MRTRAMENTKAISVWIVTAMPSIKYQSLVDYSGHSKRNGRELAASKKVLDKIMGGYICRLM